MKLQVCGARIQSGNGKESGKPYEMSRLFTLSPIKPGKVGSMNIEGSGYEVAELEATADVVRALVSVKYPVMVEVEMTPRTMGGKTSFTVTGIKL